MDGEQVWTRTEFFLHREWQHLLHEKVATRYITAGGGDYPHGNFVEWYGFHRLLDELWFYDGVLPAASGSGWPTVTQTAPRDVEVSESSRTTVAHQRGAGCVQAADRRQTVEIVAVEQKKSITCSHVF